MKSFLSLALCFAMLLSLLWVFPANVSAETMDDIIQYSAQSGDLSRTPPTKEQIKTMWENITTYETKFDMEPSVTAPYSIGKLNADYLQSGEDYLNLVRYIAGLPDIELTDELNEAAQYGAVLIAASDFSHYPVQPADMDDEFYRKALSATSSSNLARAYRDISASISSFMSDSDSYNIEEVGHRRWFLNPTLKYVGFGDANYRYAAKVFDRSGNGVDYDFISWPSSGNFPEKMFYYSTAWSISLNPAKYEKADINNISVTLTRTSDGKKWIFDSNTSNDPNTKDDFFNLNFMGYGVPYCVIFRPALNDISGYSGVYTVELSGIYDKNGNSATIKYQTDFFDFNDTYHVEKYPTEKGGDCVIGCDECDYTKVIETPSEMELYWNLDNGSSWSSSFDNVFNVGDKLYMDDYTSTDIGNQKVFVFSDPSAIEFTDSGYSRYGAFTFNKEGIYSFTVYYKYSPHIYKTYTVYVGNTEGCNVPTPYIPHTENIKYPTKVGGGCTVGCYDCEYSSAIIPATSMSLWWKRNVSGSYYASVNNQFSVGDKLYLWDNSGSGLEHEKVIVLSDKNAINLQNNSRGHYTFTFNKEGIYTITIYCKYSPCVYRTFTVYVGNTEGAKTPDPFIHNSGYPIENSPYIAPDCTNEGCTEGTKCLVCGEIFSGCESIPANGHSGTIIYPTEIGGDCTIDCAHCDYVETFATNSSMLLWWSRNGGYSYYSGFDKNFIIGDNLYLWDNDKVQLSTEKIIEFSDDSAMEFTPATDYNDAIFTFKKEGIYTFSISYKYSPLVKYTYTVIVKDPNKTYNMGDINEDGEIDKKDYAMLKRYCFDMTELSVFQRIVANINGDDEVNKQDYALLKRYCFGSYVIE